MMLFVDGIYKGILYENINYPIHNYESAFELLTQLVIDQWTLEYAVVVDNGDCMCLPVEAFDGQPVLVHIDALQQAWSQLLAAKPYSYRQSNKTWLKEWFTRLDQYYAGLLTHLEKMIFLLEVRRLKVSANRNRTLRHILDSSYKRRLKLNRTLYQQTKKDRQRNQQRLLELEK